MPWARSLRITAVALRHRLDTLAPRDQLPWPARLALAPLALLPKPKRPRGERLRLALESLGPIFIKFGQLLSTRHDLLPADIAEELDKLQDKVPPFPSDQFIAIVEEALGAPVDSLFAEFEREPLASASIAQVHGAVLPSGEAVVVKAVRPELERVIEQDLVLLFAIAQLVARYLPDGRRLRPVEVVSNYQHTIRDELNLQKEAANTSQFARDFATSDLLYMPEVYWDYCRRNVLVMERIEGIPVSRVAAIQAAGIDLKSLAERGVEIFFSQVFEHNFFHADMHPGNIFVNPKAVERPQYMAVDCAIVGSLEREDQYYLARNLLAIFQRDYRLVAELHVASGWVPPDTPVGEFTGAIRSVCEPIFAKPLGEIPFAQVLVNLFQTARRFDMQVQPQLVLLQKTLLHIEGLGRQLYPDLDLWSTAKPYLERWLIDRYHPKRLAGEIWRRGPGWLEALPTLPERLGEVLDQSERLSAALPRLEAASDAIVARELRERRQRRWPWLGLATLAGAVALIPGGWQQLLELPPASLALGAIGLWWLTRR